ncbi:nitroreductase family deazaflavin-dependent oxidoreductase [Mycobacteroides immunogenum]|uniref:Deazaflavin-dependent nitroreductase n=1 Tax=Mycobacteroides immunogenum TaxID=83262 RepID=A0A7V8LSY7_9MYCO|nr:nitroreductase family deazaflavin-dependent oxidoreductase [Mycobacteroides immunogenum]AMT73878.1 deazaflavin-dependent nitroreductase family protein [Mycobacteroides immunogenum]ANO07058.1 deazaflavin-dependent nitroreductase [Mycobacteroides immunogenum]KIU40078.1 deazaflavin-dependent nitroreductase family protein [Mycobacteroides immunogenum]KPG15392.1 deazaflavin-dependent nitroreductase [Mycobacteroides immunogenum]KPG16006.1 deazaflavin-dependent nitroreductase [Mycobacteroides immu
MTNARPPRWLTPMNKVVRAFHRLGIPTGPAMVLTVPGRKTGRPRPTPITPFEVQGQLYAVGGYPGSEWARNAAAAGSGTLTRRRRVRHVRIVTVPPEAARRVLREFAVKVPVGVRFAKSAGLVRDGSPAEFEALADTLSVFRFDPD